MIFGFIGLIYYFYTKRKAKKELDANTKSNSVYTSLKPLQNKISSDYVQTFTQPVATKNEPSISNLSDVDYSTRYNFQTNTLGGALGMN